MWSQKFLRCYNINSHADNEYSIESRILNKKLCQNKRTYVQKYICCYFLWISLRLKANYKYFWDTSLTHIKIETFFNLPMRLGAKYYLFKFSVMRATVVWKHTSRTPVVLNVP